jgi:ribose transport system permease protein
MSAPTGYAATPGGSTSAVMVWRRRFRDQPIIPLLLLLVVLVVLLFSIQPGLLGRPQAWATSTIRLATPLAILAACQTLTMLTGGIDLSVATIASATGFIVASQAPSQGPFLAVCLALAVGVVFGVVNGVGVGIFRVQPLIMTLGTGLVVAGSLVVYQRFVINVGTHVPEELGVLASGTTFGFVPNSLLVLVPLTVIMILGLRRTGYGRLLYAVGDNPIAARLAGVRAWQVLLVLYVISAVLGAIAGIVISGVTGSAAPGAADSYLLPSVAAAVIGGTSIFGGRGGYAGTLVGALILTVLANLLSALKAPEPVRIIVYGAIILGVAAAYTRVTSDD